MPDLTTSSAADMTPRAILAAYDDLMDTSRMLSPVEMKAVSGTLLAATFGAAAYEAVDDRDAAIGAMMRTFLVALIDPMSADLDHLRQDPDLAAAARAEALR